MAATIGLIKSATEIVLGIGGISIDNFTFKLFYKWSVSLYIASSVTVISGQFFGDPIHCDISRDEEFNTDDSADEDVVNNYCYMYATLNTPPEFLAHCTNQRSYNGQPDVRNVPQGSHFGNTNIHNTYYQWVAVYFLFQALLFYIPRCIWLSLEGGLMKFLVMGHQERVVDDHEEKLTKLLNLYVELVHNKFNKYAFYFFFCEFLNIIVTVFMILATHVFLHYQYFDYGINIYKYYRLPVEERTFNTTVNPMCEVFPKVATCSYTRYARLGGGQEQKNAICILNLNMINDKVFAGLWFWHCVLLLFGLVRVITRLCQVSSSSIRYFLMKIQMHRFLSSNRHAKHIQHYVLNCSVGDWFVLYQMNKQMNKRFFSEFLALVSIKVNPDPYLRADPEVDIMKTDDEGPNGTAFYDEEELAKREERLRRKIAWRKHVNMFTRRRHLTTKKKKVSTMSRSSTAANDLSKKSK